MQRKWIICCGCSLFSVGLLLFILGLAVYSLINSDLRPNILAQDIITSPKSQGFARWAKNDFVGAPVMYEVFWIYNITNADAVLNNASLPIVEEVGPYYYRELHEKVFIEFLENGNKIQYWDWGHFTFEPSLSGGDPYTDKIVNLNPAYLGAIETANSDALFTVGFTGPLMGLYFKFLQTTFLSDTISNSVPTTLNNAYNTLGGGNMNTFLNTWANSTTPPSQQWSGMLVSEGTIPSQISAFSANGLWNSQDEHSLVNSAGVKRWQKAINGSQEDFEFLQNWFALQDYQLHMILNWLSNRFYDQWVKPYLLSTYNVNDLSDLAYIQWGQATITGGVSIQTLYPDQNFLLQPEYACWWKATEPIDSPTLDLATSKQLLNGPAGLFNAPNVGIFFNYVEARNWSYIQQTWGLTDVTTVLFTSYFLDQSHRVSEVMLPQIFQEGGGLITVRTVHQMLWDAPDPLLAIVQPWKPNAALNKNYTSPDQVKSLLGPTGVYSGKSDPSKVLWYYMWNGTTEIDVYPIHYPPSGTTEDGQFPPLLGPYDRLSSWNDDYQRALDLVPVGEVNVLGLKLTRYMMDNSSFEVKPEFYQFIQGFVNITVIQKAPIFLGNPHMAGAEEAIRSRVIGMKPVDFNRDYTTVDIERTLGKVVQVYKNLQVNVWIPYNTEKYIFYNPGFVTGVMFPLIWAYEVETITKPLAKQIEDQLYNVLAFQRLVVPIFVPIGLFFMIIGAFITVVIGILNYRLRQEPKEGYRPINDDS